MRTSYSPLRRSREELDALEGFDLGVHVAAADADLGVVAGEVFGHALGEGGDEDALVVFAARSRISASRSSIWPLTGRISTCGIDEAGGADDLFDDYAGGLGEFVGAGRGGDVDGLVDCGSRTLRS